MKYFEWSSIISNEFMLWGRNAPRLTEEEAYRRFFELGDLTTDSNSRKRVLNAGLWISATLVDFDDVDLHFDSRPCFMNMDGHVRKLKIRPLSFKL